MASQNFTIRPSVAGGAMGTISVTPMHGREEYRIVVTGLAPGSTHAIHDHAGGCGGAGASRHLSILAINTSDAHGVISFETSVPAFEAGSGRIVIVYATASAATIIGCADL